MPRFSLYLLSLLRLTALLVHKITSANLIQITCFYCRISPVSLWMLLHSVTFVQYHIILSISYSMIFHVFCLIILFWYPPVLNLWLLNFVCFLQIYLRQNGSLNSFFSSSFLSNFFCTNHSCKLDNLSFNYISRRQYPMEETFLFNFNIELASLNLSQIAGCSILLFSYISAQHLSYISLVINVFLCYNYSYYFCYICWACT